jgi:hypothetical protein
MKAKLLYKHKARIGARYIIELSLHQIPKSKRYTDGIKYRMNCYDEKTQFKMLMDNHHPKGHHIHIGKSQHAYEFISIDQLIDDFKKNVHETMGVKI